MRGRLDFDFRFGTSGARQPSRPAEGTPFRIAVLGDFLGGPGGLAGPDTARTMVVDVDNFDSVFARMAPTIELPGGTGDGGAGVAFRSLDEFHPDSLYERLDIFRTLRSTRAELLDPATFPAAMARLQAGSPGAQSAVPAPAQPASAAPSPEADAATLERLMGRPSSGERSSPAVDITALLKQVMAPHVVADRDPRADALVASVDAASEGLMRTILGSPRFRRLESTWRGLHALVTCEACGDGIEIHLLHATPERLAADLMANAASLERSELARALDERTDGAGAARWSLVIGAYSFGPDDASLQLMAALGAVARRAGGPLLAQANPELLGCVSFAQSPRHADWSPLPAEADAAWNALRRSPDAAWIALAAPRVLMRRPYGRRSDPVERFAFEEIAPGADHESFAWGHPAFTLAQLLAASFTDRGFEMEPGDHRELGELPAHTMERSGEKSLTPCAEAFLSEATATAMLERGITAIVSVRNRPAVIVPRIQSIAAPPAPLAGPWS